jgi:hypothetical protein
MTQTVTVVGSSGMVGTEHETPINVVSTSVGTELQGLDLTLSVADRTAPDLEAYVAKVREHKTRDRFST